MTNNNNNSKKQTSYYTIVDFPEDSQTYGKYGGNNPKKAAIKAFNELIKFVDDDLENDGKFIVYVMRNIETGQEYNYMGNKIKLKNPVSVKKNGKEITYYYKNVVSKYDLKLDNI